MMPLLVLLAGGIVTEMTPDVIREAIAYGAKEKKLGTYRLHPTFSGWSWDYKTTMAVFTTPFLRVALAAAEAKSVYRQFSESDVTPAMAAPEVAIVASAIVIRRDVNSVKAIVIVLADGKVLQPERTEELQEKFSNAYGATDAGRGLIAYFPLSVMREDSEVRVVMEVGKERRGKFQLDKIR